MVQMSDLIDEDFTSFNLQRQQQHLLKYGWLLENSLFR